MSEPTLAEVIREAIDEWRRSEPPAALDDHIAAAVIAWATGDAAVERMARGAEPRVWDDANPSWAHLEGSLRADFLALKRRRSMERARAAVAALLAQQEEGR